MLCLFFLGGRGAEIFLLEQQSDRNTRLVQPAEASAGGLTAHDAELTPMLAG